jgi:hypothetical protein
MEVNINQECTVKLLPRGVTAIASYYAKLGMEPPRDYRESDEFKAPLWEIMHIFGLSTYMGPQPPFETTVKLDAL